MDNILFAPYMTPFSISLGLLFGLMALELIFALLGGSILGLGGDVDVDLDLDADVDIGPDIDVGPELDIEGLDAGDTAEVETDIASTGIAGWLGMGQVPFLIWLGAFLLAFGLGGLILQSVLLNSVGFTLPAGLAALAVFVPALGFARRFSRVFARLLPKTESSAMSENHLGRRRGIVSQGTAARGRPAEVRVFDRHGNTHYLRAEPLRDDQEFPAGTEVLVLRKTLNEGYRLVSLTH
ncbi:MAG: OB-fold-containig protein [Paracoccaceae bacterium]